MKAKFQLIVITFIGTTIFWPLVLFLSAWLFGTASENQPIDFMTRQGYLGVVWTRNTKSEPRTLTLELVRQDQFGGKTEAANLVQLALEPSEEVTIGIKIATSNLTTDIGDHQDQTLHHPRATSPSTSPTAP